ncbi:MAG: transglycosylase SLT domain-containing protein [Pseudomonadota bacterium]
MRISLISPFLFLIISHASAATSQRNNFLAAEQAFNRDNLGLYHSLKPGLEDYPLYPYLKYGELKKRLDTISSSEVSRFLTTYPGSGPAYLLRGLWLERLAAEGRWQEVVKYFDDGDDRSNLRCLYLRALIHTDRSDQAYAQAEALWLHGDSRPDSCDALFASWRKADKLSSELVWERIALAIENGNSKLARHLGSYLAAEDKKWLDRWIQMRADPAKALSSLPGNHPYKARMTAYGLRRLGNRRPKQALSRWKRLKKKSDFTAGQQCEIDQGLARALYREPENSIYRFFTGTAECADYPELLQARLRAALLRQDWQQLLGWIDQMPSELQRQKPWRYWKARALEQTGYQAAAAALYRTVSRDRSFYAYLASDHTSAPYRHAHQVAPVSSSDKLRLKRDPAMQRMLELHRLGRDVELRREWRLQMQRLDASSKQAAAAVFNARGMLDRAIFTLAKAGYWDDLEIRFPLEHRTLIEEQAARRGIEPAWAFAILRQESAFMADIKSSAGAHGLMQLMPATARQVARHDSIKSPSVSELGSPATNIALGTGYLGMMMKKFNGNMTLATAAYNAGPDRANSWRPRNSMPADIWVELIPFAETRKYVKRVMTYATIYDRRLGVEQRKISDRLGVIPLR